MDATPRLLLFDRAWPVSSVTHLVVVLVALSTVFVARRCLNRHIDRFFLDCACVGIVLEQILVVDTDDRLHDC